MKIWQLQEMKAKVFTDNDLLDEVFISPNEVSGYFNEALQESAAEILGTDQDYFLTKYFLPVVAGTSVYNLPSNIYANKIRSIIYSNGAVIYPIVRFRRMNEFHNIAFSDFYGQSDDYRYILINDVPGQASLEFHPPSRETAILPPNAAPFTPVLLWYIRNVNRVPMVAFNGMAAEFCNPELLAPAQFNIVADTIQTSAGSLTIGIPQRGVPGGYPGSIPYVTGDIVTFTPAPGDVLPSPLVQGVSYYVIAGASGSIQVATTLANALANVPINLTTVPGVYTIMQVAATTNIVNATLIDIPEFATFIMQWVKCRCMGKEDPRLAGELETLVQQKKEMVDALSTSVPDDDDTITPDFSHYQEMS